MNNADLLFSTFFDEVSQINFKLICKPSDFQVLLTTYNGSSYNTFFQFQASSNNWFAVLKPTIVKESSPKDIISSISAAAKNKNVPDQISDINTLLGKEVDKFELLTNYVNEVICLHDPLDAKYLWVSPSIEKLVGFKPSDLIGKTPYDFFHSDFIATLINDHLKTTTSVEENVFEQEIKVMVRTKEGGFKWVEAISKPIFNENKDVILIISITRDITNNVLAEQKLEAYLSQLKLQKVALDKSALVSITDYDGHILYVNEKFTEVSQYSEEEVLGKKHGFLNSGRHEPEFFKEIKYTIKGGEIWQGEICNKAKDGAIFWVETSIVPFKNEEGEITKFVYIRTDISKLKDAEEGLQTRHFELDSFYYHVSHDLRGPLASIMGLTQLIQLETGSDQVKSYTDKIDKSIQQLDQYIRTVLDHSRLIHSYEPATVIEFEGLIRSLLSECTHLEGYDRVDVRIDVDQRNVFMGNLNQIQIILKNVLDNSLRYFKIKYNSNWANFCIQLNRKEAYIVVEDNGEGISKSRIEEVFKMFYRGNERATGSGLGLYMVRQLIDKMGGSVNIQSEFGEGTKLEIRIPNQMDDL